MICAERAIGSEIILGVPDGTPRYVDEVKARFSMFEDVNLGTR
jgi:hypothetical protein